MIRTRVTLLALCGAFWSTDGHAADDLQFALGLDYQAGSGEPAGEADRIAMPLAATYRVDRLRLKVGVPYIRAVKDRQSEDGRSTEGFGDIGLGLTYTLPVDPDTFVDFTAKTKLPTSARELGLSTGAADLTLEAEGTHWFGEVGTSIRASRRVVVLGNSYAAVDAWGAGGSVMKAVGTSSISLSLDWRQSTFVRAPDILDVTGAFSTKIARHFRLQGFGYISKVGNRTYTGLGTQIVFRFQS